MNDSTYAWTTYCQSVMSWNVISSNRLQMLARNCLQSIFQGIIQHNKVFFFKTMQILANARFFFGRKMTAINIFFFFFGNCKLFFNQCHCARLSKIFLEFITKQRKYYRTIQQGSYQFFLLEKSCEASLLILGNKFMKQEAMSYGRKHLELMVCRRRLSHYFLQQYTFFLMVY